MYMILFIYTFSLFIILTPSFLIKTNDSLINKIFYGLLFAILYNFTYDLVKGKRKEGLDLNVTIVGASKLERMLEQIFKEKETEDVYLSVNNNNAAKLFSR